MPKPKVPNDISEIFHTEPIAYELSYGRDTEVLNVSMEQAVKLMDVAFKTLMDTMSKSASKHFPGVVVAELDFGSAQFIVAMKVDADGDITHWHTVVDRCLVEDD